MRRVIRSWMLAVLVLAVLSPGVGAQTLVVGCDTDFKPFVFTGADGKTTGFDIELWDALAKRLGIAYRLEPMAFKDLIPALVQKRIDAALAGMTLNSKREEQIDFSVPYYTSSLNLLVRADEAGIEDIGDLVDKIVATKLDSSSVVFVKNIQTRAFKLYPAIEEAYAALENGKVDAVIFDEPAVDAYARSKGAGRVKIVGGSYHRQFYGIGFQPNSIWREKINIALLQLMEEGYYDIVFRKWFGYVPQ